MDIDQHLERTKDLHAAFKGDALKMMACRIVEVALERGEIWPDQVDHEDLAKDDRNVIGSAFRMLNNIGIIQRSTQFRRSKAEDARGRVVFAYHLRDERMARAFVGRNKEQEQMALL